MGSSCAAIACRAIDSVHSLRFRCAVPPSVLDRVVRTESLASVGKSGSTLDRGWLDDGSTVVIKHADARHDWIMQATRDGGRVAGLWADGVFARLPACVDHATVDVHPAPGGAVIVMRDVSAQLFGDAPPTPAQRRAVLTATAAMHEALADTRTAHLCRLTDYLTFLSPTVCARFAPEHLVPQLALEGWGRFRELVDDDVIAVVDSVHADPAWLAAALLERPSTIVHGDLKLANLGTDGATAILLDWGTLTTWAPPAVDYAWYLAINAAGTGLAMDEVQAEVRTAQGAAHDETALRLALVGALAQLGWEKALGATSAEPSVRDRERRGLEWWSAEVRRALDDLPF